MIRRSGPRIACLVLASAVSVAACWLGTDPGRTWFEVANETDEALDILYDRAAGMMLAPDVPPGVKANVSNPGEPACTEHDVVARNQAGEEVARHEPPLCGGDVWTIADGPD